MNPFVLSLKVYGLDVAIHRHAACQIVIALNGTFSSTIDGVAYTGITGFAIRPQVAHLCTVSKETVMVIINIEPYSRAGLQLQQQLPAGERLTVFRDTADLARFFAAPEQSATVNQLTAITDFLAITQSIRPPDDRVQKLVAAIETEFTAHSLTPEHLASLVFLSPSRMGALFKKETGSSVSKYLLWTRLRHAISLALSDKTRHLTDIALEAGFYDQPQFTKYMYEMTGVPPRALRQNSDLIQVLA